MSTIEVGELLYEYEVKFTGITEYGVSLESLVAGEAAPPPEGARIGAKKDGYSLIVTLTVRLVPKPEL